MVIANTLFQEHKRRLYTWTSPDGQYQYNRLIPNRKRNKSRLYIVTLLILIICRVHHEKHWAGGSTRWNPDCWENIKNLRYADDTTLMAESEEELKSLLMKVKEESEKVSLKLSIQKTKIIASSLITSWQIDGKTLETAADYFWGLGNHCR